MPIRVCSEFIQMLFVACAKKEKKGKTSRDHPAYINYRRIYWRGKFDIVLYSELWEYFLWKSSTWEFSTHNDLKMGSNASTFLPNMKNSGWVVMFDDVSEHYQTTSNIIKHDFHHRIRCSNASNICPYIKNSRNVFKCLLKFLNFIKQYQVLLSNIFC